MVCRRKDTHLVWWVFRCSLIPVLKRFLVLLLWWLHASLLLMQSSPVPGLLISSVAGQLTTPGEVAILSLYPLVTVTEWVLHTPSQ